MSASRVIGIATIERCLRTCCERKRNCISTLGIAGTVSLPCGGTTCCCVVRPIILAADARVVFGTDALSIPFASSILIIVIFTNIALDITRGTGVWAHQKPRLGLWLRNFGVIYFMSM